MLFKYYIYIQENYRKGINGKQDSGWQLSLCGGEEQNGKTCEFSILLLFRGDDGLAGPCYIIIK